MGLSDRSDCAADLTVMHQEEVLADKLKCLLQRQSIRDLFDLIPTPSVFNDEIPVDRNSVVSAFLNKTISSTRTARPRHRRRPPTPSSSAPTSGRGGSSPMPTGDSTYQKDRRNHPKGTS
ncbi:hypothetical protein ACIQCF_39630 [Streptomyces sp. NPDC088353]|uniref:hypothetical protein n=1 Tax=Streptomyces sp. NPDC088353 TaxID=3365855 RepID=UPI00382E275E